LKPLKYLAALLLMAAFGAAGFVGMAFVQVHGRDLAEIHEVAHWYAYQKALAQQKAAQGEQSK
jgi:hypothetical protein